MTLNRFSYDRLIYLNQKINNNTASKAEKDEYMRTLYDNGNITKEQYDKYMSDGATQEEIMKAALTIGGIILVAYLVERLLK